MVDTAKPGSVEVQSPPQLVEQIGRGYDALQRSMAAYSALLRAADAAAFLDPQFKGTRPPDNELQRPPILTWPARDTDDKLVEITTDLAKLHPADLQAVLVPLTNLHAEGMAAAATIIFTAAGQLLNMIKQLQDAATDPVVELPAK